MPTVDVGRRIAALEQHDFAPSVATTLEPRTQPMSGPANGLDVAGHRSAKLELDDFAPSAATTLEPRTNRCPALPTVYLAGRSIAELELHEFVPSNATS
jgi:hypothetical protein